MRTTVEQERTVRRAEEMKKVLREKEKNLAEEETRREKKREALEAKVQFCFCLFHVISYNYDSAAEGEIKCKDVNSPNRKER